MKLIVNNNDTYDIGHDDSINEYILYVTTDDGVLVKALDDVYGENVLQESIAVLRKQYNFTKITYLSLDQTTEETLNG
jgi:hypothetical protein